MYSDGEEGNVAYDYSDGDYDGVDEVITTQQPRGGSRRRVEAAPQQEQHEEVVEIPRQTLTLDQFSSGVKTHTLSFSITGTPAELARGNPMRFIWKPAAHSLREFKHNVAETNRDKAPDSALAGSLLKGIIVGLTITEDSGDAPYQIGINMDKQMKMTMGAHGSFMHIIKRNTPTRTLKKHVFNPTDFITRDAYEQQNLNSRAELRQHITIKKDQRGGSFGCVTVGTMAHRELKKRLQDDSYRAWDREPILKDQFHVLINPPRHQPEVHISAKMAQDLLDELEAPLREFEERCVNMENIHIVATRADGRAWNDLQGMVSPLIGGPLGADVQTKTDLLNTPFEATCDVQIHFVLGK